MAEITTGEANRMCFEEKKQNEHISCFLCGYQSYCWVNAERKEKDDAKDS